MSIEGPLLNSCTVMFPISVSLASSLGLKYSAATLSTPIAGSTTVPKVLWSRHRQVSDAFMFSPIAFPYVISVLNVSHHPAHHRYQARQGRRHCQCHSWGLLHRRSGSCSGVLSEAFFRSLLDLSYLVEGIMKLL